MSEFTVSRQMPRYRCHKLVFALKIESHAGGTLTPADKLFAPLTPEAGYWRGFHAARKLLPVGTPSDYGYYVVYEDGYGSYSPTEAFESGYQREMDPPPAFFPLSSSELKALAESPQAMQALEDYHDSQSAQADAMDYGECVPYHTKRADLFRELVCAAVVRCDAEGIEVDIPVQRPVNIKPAGEWMPAVASLEMMQMLERHLESSHMKTAVEDLTAMEAFAVIVASGRPLEMREGHARVEFRAKESLWLVRPKGKWQAILSEEDPQKRTLASNRWLIT